MVQRRIEKEKKDHDTNKPFHSNAPRLARFTYLPQIGKSNVTIKL